MIRKLSLLFAGALMGATAMGVVVYGTGMQANAAASETYKQLAIFGDIFERDNLDWQSREIATVAMLSALEGVAPQLQAHIRIAMNTGVTPQQLRQLIRVLAEQVSADASRRASEALELHLAAK